MIKGIGGVEVTTDQGTRHFPYEEEAHLVPAVTRVRAATAAALPSCTLSGNVLTAAAVGALGAIDTGVTMVAGDLLLVKNQVAGLQNGVYEILNPGSASEAWSMRRAVGWDVTARVKAGRVVTVSEGTANGNKLFMLTTDDPIVLNTTALVFGSALAAAVGAGEITLAMMAAESVDSDQYVDGSIDTAHFAAGAVDAAALGAAAVTATKQATDNASVTLVDHADATPVTLLAASAAGVTRLVLVTAVCSETLGGTTPTTMSVGTAGSVELALSAAALAASTGGGDNGDVTEGRCILPAAAALICTIVNGVGGTPAGKITFYVSATRMPTP